MVCPKCGKENSINTKFCTECGSNLYEKQTTADAALMPNTNIASDGWYYSLNNQRFGPIDHFTISNMLSTGNIRPETLVWRTGMINWIPAGQTELFYMMPVHNQIANTPPAMPVQTLDNSTSTVQPSKVPNITAWLLATIPLGVSMIASSVGGKTGYYIGIAIAFILNIVFLFIDDINLRKHGVDTKKWSWCGLVLIPVYLFIRSAKVGKKFGYSIFWCIFAFMDMCIYVALFAST